MSLTSSGVEYDFRANYEPYGVGITSYKKGMFVCYTNEVWAIYNESIGDIKEYINNEDEQSLDVSFIRGGQGNMMINFNWNALIGNPVTILLNGPATIYYLYEV